MGYKISSALHNDVELPVVLDEENWVISSTRCYHTSQVVLFYFCDRVLDEEEEVPKPGETNVVRAIRWANLDLQA